MKNTFLTTAVLALGFAAGAQTTQSVPATNTQNAPTTTTADTTVAPAATAAPATNATMAPATNTTVTATKPKWNGRNGTVDSISAKYKLLPMPGELTLEKKFPAVGTYQLSGDAATAGTVTITLDSSSKGVIWVNGLPQGTFKAYLAKSPATYRIISQKSVTGTQVPEGTLYFSPETSTLQVALGAPFNAENPVAIFPVTDSTVTAETAAPVVAEVKVKKEGNKTKTKSKNKVTFYTASKVNTMDASSSNAAFGQQLQASQQQ